MAHFSRGLSLMLRRLTGDPALADDLLQDTLALVLTKIRHGEVREPERLAGFVRSLARNLWIADRARELPRRAVFLLLLAVVETDQPLVHPLGSEG